jgi:hypothetical protein
MGWLSCCMLSCTCTQSFAQPGDNGSHFGLDYVFPTDPQYQNKPLARIYQEAGLKWVNFADVKWQYFEPHKPRGGQHTYNWDKLDKAVVHWLSHGFDITLTLRLGKSWFTGPKKIDVDLPPVLKAMALYSDRLPKPVHYQDYEEWLTALVERYDGDGVQDMPGLIRPILYYQIGNEYGNPVFFSGTLDDYFILLEMASRSIRAASTEAKVIPNGFRTNDLFHNDPDAQNAEASLERFFARQDDLHVMGWQRGMDLDERIIEERGRYDLIDAGGNGSWHTAAEGYFNYVRNLQKKYDNELPVWDMEARNEPLLTPIETTHFHMDLGIPQGKHILNLLKWRNNKDHKKAVKWYREEQARITAKVFISKFAAGYEKVFMGMPMDWDKGISALTWPNPFMGFLDSNSKKWPAYFTLKFLIEELDTFTFAQKIESEEGVSLYKFVLKDEKVIHVAWLEDKKPRGLNARLPGKKVTVNGIHATKALEIPMNTEGTRKRNFKTTQRGCTLSVSPTPVFIFQEEKEES